MRLFLITPALAALTAAALLDPLPADASRFDRSFWNVWGDGRAEIATYDLTYPRYGEERPGTAVAVFVTETFSEAARVKADPGVHDESDEFPVMKLNLVQDFATGIYDYNLMTSAFVALADHAGRPEGSPAKVAFSSQEWCGQVWHELLVDESSIRSTRHSYFDGEADDRGQLPYPKDGVLEDGLLLWARGIAAPFLRPGETRTVPLLRSVEVVRLAHVPMEWEEAKLSRSDTVRTVEVPAGPFEVETLTAELSGGRSWEILVETAEPRRIVGWSTSDGKSARLLATERLQYWRMHGGEDLRSLEKIGLTPRPPRTP